MAVKKDKDTNKENKCSFCGKTKKDVALLFNGEFGSICNECCDQIYNMNLSIINHNTNFIPEDEFHKDDVKKPTEIKEFLDQYVIGQDKAKQRLAVAVYNHYKRIKQKGFDDVEIEKSNCICIGDTGVGKCISPDTLVTIRNKKTGDIQFISVDDFKNLYLTEQKEV